MESEANPCRKRLALLRNLAVLLEEEKDASRALNRALDLMAAAPGLMRGAITLIEPKTGQIRIEASCGLKAAQRRLGEYERGEGVTGKVIASGQAMCIADVSREPLFLNRTRCRDLSRERISFICVPIWLNGEVVGALSADMPGVSGQELEDELGLMQIIAGLLGPAACGGQERMEARPNGRPKGFIGNSEVMRQVYDQIAIVAPSATTVFLQGESGTGKELAANAIHDASPRSSGPFVSLNCAALPESLIESELFGHERGAFTGAAQKRKGRFELANGGTLFLDEVGEISAMAQAKLLRVLQEKAFERVGGMETLRCDVRLIAATNRNLAQLVEAGAFRRDLFYRLNVFPIVLPPLRERREDIPPLAAHFLEVFARASDRKTPGLSLAAMDMLQRYSWPGNIRELQNAMERAILLLGHEHLVLPQHLPPELHEGLAYAAPERKSGETCRSCHARQTSLRARLQEVERACVAEALAACSGNSAKAAAMLGVTPRIMGLRMQKYRLDFRDFRKKDGATDNVPS